MIRCLQCWRPIGHGSGTVCLECMNRIFTGGFFMLPTTDEEKYG